MTTSGGRARRAAWIGVVVALWGGGCGSPADVCVDASAALAPDLTCAEADVALSLLEVLAARPVDAGHRASLREALRDAFLADPASTRASLEASGALLRRVVALDGIDAAEVRSQSAYQAVNGQGPLAIPGLLVAAPIAVWAHDDRTGLVLTESDIEAWIRYASLCREVQGGGPLVLSVSDRRPLYEMLVDRFVAADRPTQVAMAGVAPFWDAFREQWKAAPAEQQQAWVRAAPLPPPMTASSLAYVEAVLQSDLSAHLAVWHASWAPMRVKVQGVAP
jgi:hypothetical protein